MIDGEHITKDDTFDSINPANTSELIAKVSKATKEDVDKAFESSNKAYKAWRQWSHKDRAELLLRVAAIIRRRKEEISAVMVYEAGKPWDERWRCGRRYRLYRILCTFNDGISRW